MADRSPALSGGAAEAGGIGTLARSDLMAQNRRSARKRRPRNQDLRTKSRRKATTKRARARPRRQQPDVQAQIFQVFAEQADSLWGGLVDQCRQFADGFNNHVGAQELKIRADATTLRAAYRKGDAELFVTLDKTLRYVQCWVNAGCDANGCCSTDQPPVGMTVRGDALHFAFGGEIVTDEHLAITLLTQLTNGNFAQEGS